MNDSKPTASAAAQSLREIQATAQDSPGYRRRWFNSEDFDLFLWIDQAGKMARLQLAYRQGKHAFALTWNAESGFRHDCIDDGESRPARYKMSPLLHADGDADAETLLHDFETAAQALEPTLKSAVIERLQQYLALTGQRTRPR